MRKEGDLLVLSNKRVELLTAYIGLGLASFLAISPVMVIIFNSFKHSNDIFSTKPIWGSMLTLENYKHIFINRNFLHFLINSLIVSTSSTLLSLVFAIPAAYGFSRYDFKAKRDLLFWILSQRMLPPIAIIIPVFLIMRTLRLLDTYPALIITYLIFNLPFSIWLLNGYFEEIPTELDESARIDGCSNLEVIFKVVLPPAIGGILTTAILCIVFSWNEFLFALILTGQKTQTATVITTALRAPWGMGWGDGLAAASVTILPIILFVLILGNKFQKGLTLGAIK